MWRRRYLLVDVRLVVGRAHFVRVAVTYDVVACSRVPSCVSQNENKEFHLFYDRKRYIT